MRLLSLLTAFLLSGVFLASDNGYAVPNYVVRPAWIGSDVLGRDLAIPGLGWAGHIGMYAGSDRVIEVMNESTVIQRNTIWNFNARSKYWGTRYYAPSGPKSKHDYPTITAFAWGQRSWHPSYTYGSSYQIGQVVTKRVWNAAKKRYENQSVNQNAIYRCDTFVVASIKKGINKNFASSPQTPKGTYYKLPYDYTWVK